MRPLLRLFAVLCAVGVATTRPAIGQDGAPAGFTADVPADDDAGQGIPGLPPGPPPPADQVDRIARDIGLGLRCPVCQGLSVADSTSSAAVMMQRRIRELVAQGYDRDDINDFFASKYGEWVLLQPRNGGLNQLVWIGPLLAFGLGLIAASSMLVRRDDDEGPDTVVSDAARRGPDGDDVEDPHLARLLSEVDDD
ncbi:MAG: cytochrome c-type biogenesis protein CcmH [Alphaproteobacteria bacterium]|nr:cytochrome c-type biogenesis protein CcmH [Alphaproteobacteria bacterium]